MPKKTNFDQVRLEVVKKIVEEQFSELGQGINGEELRQLEQLLVRRSTATKPFDAILNEVEQLNGVGTRLEELAKHHAPVAEYLLTIAGNVRSTATLLAVVVATKLLNGDGRGGGT